VTKAEQDVLIEREKQREKWTVDHDDSHGDFALAAAAAHLACPLHAGVLWGDEDGSHVVPAPPWAVALRLKCRHGREGQRRRMVVAAALLIAEVERLDRLHAMVQDDTGGRDGA
jgi:hypothetical protein